MPCIECAQCHEEEKRCRSDGKGGGIFVRELVGICRCRCEVTYSVVRLNEGVVDGNNLDVGVLDSVAEDDTADTTETVDANLDGSHDDDLRE